MITAGLGIGPLPIHVARRDVEDGLLWRLPPYENPPAVDVYVIHNPRTHLNRAERSMLDMLLAGIREMPMEARDYAS